MRYDAVNRVFTELPRVAMERLAAYCYGEEVPELYWRHVAYAYEDAGKPASIGRGLAEFQEAMKLRSIEHPIPANVPLLTTTTPAGTKLFDYQVRAIPSLHRGSMLLGDGMGLGKSLTLLHAWWTMGSPKMTIIVPSDSVAEEWIAQLETHYGITEDILHLTKRLFGHEISQAKIILIPYSRFWREGYWEEIRRRVTPETILIFDEAHRLANLSSRQHQAAESLCRYGNPRRWMATGTEVANTPESYFGVYVCITLSKLPKVAYMEYVYNQWTKQWRENRLSELRTLRKTFALRRTRGMLREQLPPLTVIPIKVGMDDITREIYRDLEATAQAEIQTLTGEGKTITEVSFMAVYGKLLHLCSHPRSIGEGRVELTPKLEKLFELVDSAGSESLLIWSNYPTSIEFLAEALGMQFPGKRIATVYGKTAQAERQETKLAFQAGRIDCIIANPAVWSEGVNLTKATINIYWDYHPSRVRWVQSKERSHRTGQTNPVTIYQLVTRNSVESKLLSWLDRKTALAEMISGG